MQSLTTLLHLFSYLLRLITNQLILQQQPNVCSYDQDNLLKFKPSVNMGKKDG